MGELIMQTKGNDIQRRLIKFAAQVIRLCDTLPANSIASTHIARQLMRSGTSPAANYGEARGAESTADFIHKLRIAVKELNESEVWMELIVESRLQTADELAYVIDECIQLQRILNASVKTARNSIRK